MREEKRRNEKEEENGGGRRLLYDISSWSETERRNEMTLKAAFNEWDYI